MRTFIDDYYKLDLDIFKEKVLNQIGCDIDHRGYVLYQEKKLPIRDLAFLANKENKSAKELQQGRERGTQLLHTLFNDPKTGFMGADKLLRRAKESNPKITLKQVKEFLSLNPIHQVFQKPTLQKQTPRIHGKIGHYQADLTFLTRYKKQNSNYHILLNVINVNTKYV